MQLIQLIINELFAFTLLLCHLDSNDAISRDDYLKLRKNTINNEDSSFFGGNLMLVGNEILTNECLMSAKSREIEEGRRNLSRFWPSRNFLDIRHDIEQSRVFKIIRLMPKGAVLHTHGTSTASLDFVFQNLTRIPNLYVCSDNATVRFGFFETPNDKCDWKAMEDVRKSHPDVAEQIKKNVSLPNSQSTPGYNSELVWKKFGEMFNVFEGLISYRPAFEMYLERTLQELYDDKIMYFEFRGPFYRIYELNGTVHNPTVGIRIFKDIVEKFVKSHPRFLGAKFIYESNRQLSHEEFDEEANVYRKIKRTFPNFVVGFDISNYEDGDHPNVYFVEKLLEVSNETTFYFHAGETNWFGHSADENLFDAVLLNSKRIGHGFALLKHPKLMKMVKEKDIAIEVNPVSNQVLGYVADLRNHPAAYYFANNFSVVVSNDNPSFWGSTGLSYDYYEAFVGIMSRKADLRALKQLAINSIAYSAMTHEEKQTAFRTWNSSWLEFVNYLSHENHCQEILNSHKV